MSRVHQILNRFPRVVQELSRRHSNRRVFVVKDEYDVQDLLHALLTLDFDDIRTEEWTPSYAGACARMDLLLKNERIVIEAKMTRKGLGAREVGDQLLLDIARYRGHPDCETLICFVYDVAKRIRNGNGVQHDLEQQSSDELGVKVIIVPT